VILISDHFYKTFFDFKNFFNVFQITEITQMLQTVSFSRASMFHISRCLTAKLTHLSLIQELSYSRYYSEQSG